MEIEFQFKTDSLKEFRELITGTHNNTDIEDIKRLINIMAMTQDELNAKVSQLTEIGTKLVQVNEDLKIAIEEEIAQMEEFRTNMPQSLDSTTLDAAIANLQAAVDAADEMDEGVSSILADEEEMPEETNEEETDTATEDTATDTDGAESTSDAGTDTADTTEATNTGTTEDTGTAGSEGEVTEEGSEASNGEGATEAPADAGAEGAGTTDGGSTTSGEPGPGAMPEVGGDTDAGVPADNTTGATDAGTEAAIGPVGEPNMTPTGPDDITGATVPGDENGVPNVLRTR